MSEREAIAYIEQWDVTEAAKVLKWYEDNELLRPCDCDTMIAIETESLRDENAKLRKENDTLCRRIDTLCMENEQLRNQHTAKARRIVVSNHDTDCATGHSECSACSGTVNPFARYCEHCGAEFGEDA